MSSPINSMIFSQFIQQVRSAEHAKAKSVVIDIARARQMVLSIAELLEKANADYETLFQQLKNTQPTDSVISVSMDGGRWEL